MTAKSPLQGPRGWNSQAIFRETFLCRRLPKEIAGAARVLGRLLDQETGASPGESKEADPVQRVLLAAARDLRHLEGYLKSQELTRASEPRATSRLLVAHQVAESLGRLAGTLEAASR